MTRQSEIRLALFLTLYWAVASAVLLAKGGLYVEMHEGDTIHLIDMVLRQAEGEWPHIDYMTPIGWLATAPVALFVWLGFGFGMAMLLAQAFMAAALILPVWWVGVSRMSFGWSLVFGAICLALMLAMTYGGDHFTMSVSMHYNRWAWAISFLAICIAVLPPIGRRSQVADGLVLGLAVSALVLIKVTYVVALPAVLLLSLIVRRQWRALATAAAAGAVIVLLMAMLGGLAFWPAYLGDLLAVVGGENRQYPGDDLRMNVVGPTKLAASLTLLLAVIFASRTGRTLEAVLLLLLFPGFVYITYQNFGNDPQWLYLLVVLLPLLRPDSTSAKWCGLNAGTGLAIAAMAAFLLSFSSLRNIFFSPIRHLAVNAAEFGPLLGERSRHDDVYSLNFRTERPFGEEKRQAFAEMHPARDAEEAEEAEKDRAILNGELLPDCEMSAAAGGYYQYAVRDLEAAGFSGSSIFVADLLSGYWLFGDIERLPGAAPWYYTGLPGLAAADYVLVPTCAWTPKARAQMLREIAARGIVLEEVYRRKEHILLQIQRP